MKILIVTALDLTRMWNSVEGNMARCFAAQGHEVTVLSKVMNRSLGWRRLILDVLGFRTRTTRQDGFTLVSLDPFFNYYAGLGWRIGAESGTPEGGRGRRRLRWLIVGLGRTLAVLRDVCSVPAYFFTAMWAGERRYDVALGYGPWGTLTAWLMRRFRCARICVYKDIDFEPGLMPDRFRRAYTAWLEAFLVRRADLVVSVGYRLAALRERQSGRKAPVIPNGVDWERFAPARERQGDGHTIIYVGNLVPWGGLELIIQSMPRILAQVAETRLVIIGEGVDQYRERLTELAAQAGVSNAVSLPGAAPNERLPEVLGEGVIGLANSEPNEYRRYAYPLKVIEYMAAGMAVIATEDTEASEIVERCECGVSCSFTQDSFVAAVVRLLGDREELRRMQSNAVRHSAGMTWRQLMDREAALIEQRLADAP